MAATERASRRLLLGMVLASACAPTLNRTPPGEDLGSDLTPRDRALAEAPAAPDLAARDRGGDRKLCGSAAECDDGLECTSDQCTAGACVHELQPCVTTVAGTGLALFADGPTASAAFHNPTGVAVNPAGDLVLVADSLNRRVRQITGGQVSTVAGTGSVGGADGAAASASFNLPFGVALDAAANRIYVSDQNLHRIRLIEAGQVSTFAGKSGDGDDDGPALSAGFRFPAGLALATGQLLVADSENHRIRAIAIAGPTVSTLAGSGAGYSDGPAIEADFNSPQGVAVDGTGQVLVADRHNHRIRTVVGGVVGTAAGSGAGFLDGPAATAKLNAPHGVAVDAQGTVYIADRNNHRIRMLSAGGVSTLAGTGAAGWLDGPAGKARFYFPTGIAVDAQGRVFVADTFNHRIRCITR